MLKQLRFLKPPVPVFRERGVMRNFLSETQAREPPPGQVHAQFLHQFALAGDAVQIPNQQPAQQKLGIDRRPSSFAVAVFQLPPHKLEADVLVDQPQQMSFRDLVFQTEVIEQSFRAVVLPHHDQQASENGNPAQHVEVLTRFR